MVAAMASSTRSTASANSASRRVRLPKRSRKASPSVDEPEERPEPESDLVRGVGGLGRGLGDRLEQLRADVVEELEVERPLRGDVLIEHRLGDPGRVGDVVHRGLVEAVLGEQPEGHPEQLGSPAGGRQALGHDGVIVPGPSGSAGLLSGRPRAPGRRVRRP